MNFSVPRTHIATYPIHFILFKIASKPLPRTNRHSSSPYKTSGKITT